MAGEFSLFWSIVVPLLMVAGSIAVTWALYRHFAAKVGQKDD
jgi:predicted alpha/beta hydrolase